MLLVRCDHFSSEHSSFRAYLMVTPLELSMSTLCLFLGFSTSASRVAPFVVPLLRDL
jgi:hypothetical protein